MLSPISIEAIARAKKLEMESLRSNHKLVSEHSSRKVRAKYNKLDLLVKIEIQPKFSVGVTMIRGLGQ